MTQPTEGADEALADAAASEPGESPTGGEQSGSTHGGNGEAANAEASTDAEVAEAADPGAGEASSDASAGENGSEPLTVEGLVESLEQVTTERDGYYDSLARLQAEFENYRKAVAKREADARERANESLVGELLPVLDACDGAIANGAEDVAPVRTALLESLQRQGLSRLEPTDAPFDPEQHEAVMHEEGSDGDGPVVAEVLRVGYQWKGRTVRAAMVRVKG